jgi:hypothetical protein
MKIGSLVECIDDNWDLRNGEKMPVKGEIYTVRAIVRWEGQVGLKLEEVVNPVMNYVDAVAECSFDARYFREIQPPMNISELLENLQTELA